MIETQSPGKSGAFLSGLSEGEAMGEQLYVTDDREFAEQFLWERVRLYQKDVDICLTPSLRDGLKPTHAYFPAFMSCMGLLDFASCLSVGCLRRNGWGHIGSYCEAHAPELNCPEFRVVFKGFRHKVAHGAHPYIVYKVCKSDADGAYEGALVKWVFDERDLNPAVEVIPHERRPLSRPLLPWPVAYDHSLTVYIGRLSRLVTDSIVTGPRSYLETIRTDDKALARFKQCMDEYYPRA